MAPVKTALPDRALVMDLDTLTQADRWPAPQWFAGVLRTADLFGERVVLLDVQVLDGAFVLQAGPTGIELILGRAGLERAVFHLTARSADLAEALRAMAVDADGAFTAFEWSCLAAFGAPAPSNGSLRGRDAARVRTCAPADLPRILAAELQSAVPGAEPVDEPTGAHLRLAEAWEAWIEAVDRGRVPIREWDPERYAVPRYLAREPDGGADAELVALARSCTRRSDLRRLLRGVDARADGGVPGSARDRIEQWWLRAYFAALADQHGAGWFALSTDLTPEPAPGTAAPRPLPDAVQLEGRSVEILGSMPGAAYAALRHRARGAVAAWAATPSQRTADGLGYAVRSAEEETDLYADRRAAWRRLVLAVVPAVAGGLVTLLSSEWAGLWIAVAGALGVLIAVPLIDLVELHQTRPARMRAYLHVPGLGRG